jgi:hypothetical protein
MKPEISQVILAAYRTMNLNIEAAQRKLDSRRQELYREYNDRLRADSIILESEQEQKQWIEALRKSALDMFGPGTIIRTNHDNYYYVVIEVSITPTLSIVRISTTKQPGERQLRRWRNRTVYISAVTEILEVEDLPKDLQRKAENMIAKVRLKDW